ncbi:MAG: hypothetical protein P4L56_19250 [Candidatus Sulfopaludibacter sp.]|nr:hypothetical protein [Candidatus Sulfopaludibacter sp.]
MRFGGGLRLLSIWFGMCALGVPVLAQGTCGSATVGYQVNTLTGGLKFALWYPSTDAESTFQYQPLLAGSNPLSGSVALNGAPATNCGRFPLVVFSHGYAGCGLQSVFFTEQLARHGYIVAAPDHQDASVCSVDGTGSFNFGVVLSSLAFLNPGGWTDATYVDRKNDVEQLINALVSGTPFGAIIDANRIGVSGHSLGGYTALGVAGAWASWADTRIKAVLAFSPFSLPFTTGRDTIPKVTAPVMYQTGGLDILQQGVSGAYTDSNPSKYLGVLKDATHITWTNLVCSRETTIAACLQSEPDATAIDNYGIAFLDRYLNGIGSSLLTGGGSPALSSYQRMSSATSVSEASYASPVAPSSIVSAFGDFGAAAAAAGGQNLPTVLSQYSVQITDAGGTARLAPLYYVSPPQINYVMPAGTQAGTANVSVLSGSTVVATGTVKVNNVAPALFAAQGTLAAGQFLRVAAGGTQTQGLLFDPSTLAPVPVSLSGADQVYLILYGTGMRGFSQSASAVVGGFPVSVIGPEAQPQFAGLDQINLGPLPQSLKGAGTVSIAVRLDGVDSNSLTFSIE